MLEKLFSTGMLPAMEKALDSSVLRQKVIANNIANVDTPGYKALEVTFEDKLREAMKNPPGAGIRLANTNPRHIQITDTTSLENFQPDVTELKNFTLRNDGNSVDIDRETANLAKNELYYDAVMRALNDEFRWMRAIVTEGRK